MALKLKIVTPDKIVYDGEVEKITVPGTAGQFEILVNHAPIISSLDAGEVVYQAPQGEEALKITGGFVEVARNNVSLCVEV